jgi:hypothetical protein
VLVQHPSRILLLWVEVLTPRMDTSETLLVGDPDTAATTMGSLDMLPDDVIAMIFCLLPWGCRCVLAAACMR